VLIARQLMGQPIGLGAKDPHVGLVYNIGGSGASNLATVLKRIK